MLFPPIPLIPETDLPSPLPIRECDERMIPLSSLSDKISIYSAYYHDGYPGALPEVYLREGAAQKLIIAAEQLPVGHKLVVLDGWRSFEVQTSLYERFRELLLLQGWQNGPALTEELSKYVARPTTDLTQPSPHLSGGAIDLTIAGPDGWLEMGTDFDDFSERAATRHFEELLQPSQKDVLIRDNRRMLYHLMTSVGFVNYPKEWWHFEYGTRSWGRRTQQEPIYGGILRM